MKTIQIVVEINNGCVYSIYGSELPPEYEFEFIVRDRDNIKSGDEDPLAEDYEPEQYYW